MRDDKSFAMHYLIHVLERDYMQGEPGLCRVCEQSVKITTRFLYTVWFNTNQRLLLKNGLLLEDYDWDAMEQYCIQHHPELAGVLGPQEGACPCSGGFLYTEEQVIKCFGKMMCRVLSLVGP